MRISMFKSAALAAATTLASAGLVIASGSAANAATCPVTIPSIAGGTAMTYSNQSVALKATPAVTPGSGDWYVTSADVYNSAGVKVGTTSYPFSYDNTSPSVYFQNAWGRGAFTLRNLQVDAFPTAGGEVKCTPPDPAGGVVVLSASSGALQYGTGFTIRVASAKHTFNVGLRYYQSNGTYRAWGGERVQIQRLVAGKWKTIKALTLGPRGQASWVLYTRTSFKYRMIAPTKGTVAGVAYVMPRRY